MTILRRNESPTRPTDRAGPFADSITPAIADSVARWIMLVIAGDGLHQARTQGRDCPPVPGPVDRRRASDAAQGGRAVTGPPRDIGCATQRMTTGSIDGLAGVGKVPVSSIAGTVRRRLFPGQRLCGREGGEDHAEAVAAPDHSGRRLICRRAAHRRAIISDHETALGRFGTEGIILSRHGTQSPKQ